MARVLSVAGAGENRSRPGAVSAAREVAEAGCSVILGHVFKGSFDI